MADFDLDVVRDFIMSKGGKVKNNDLVSHFKTYLNDPRHKETNRAKFKQIVNTLAAVKLDASGEKMLVLKKKYRGYEQPQQQTSSVETPKKMQAPKAKLKKAFVPRAPSETDAGDNEQEEEELEGQADVSQGSLLSEIQRELGNAGLKDESSTDPTRSADDEAGATAADQGDDIEETETTQDREEEEETFEDAVSQQSSPETSPPDPVRIESSRDSEVFQDVLTEEQDTTGPYSDAPDVQEPPNQDVPDARNKVGVMEPPAAETTETRVTPQTFQVEQEPTPENSVAQRSFQVGSGNEESASTLQTEERPKSRSSSRDVSRGSSVDDAVTGAPFKSYQDDKPKQPQRTEQKLSRESSVTSSKESSVEKELPLTTPARAGSEGDVPVSVRDRAKHLNKISSQTDLKSVKQAPDNLLRKSEGREGSEESDSVHISLNKTEREWLILAAKSDYHAMHRLLTKNPQLARRKDFTSTALHWACKHGNADVVKMLFTEGVSVNAKSGYTPLHLAAMHNHENIIDLLVQVYGADANLRDYNGKKAKQYLKNSASSRAHQLLQPRRGASMSQGGSFTRVGSYSAKIRTAGHFDIKASSSVRASWAVPGGGQRSTSPSPHSSPVHSRQGSVKSLRDEELMPPPQDLPPRRRRNKRSTSRDKASSEQELNRADSDPSLGRSRSEASALPQSVSYSSVV